MASVRWLLVVGALALSGAASAQDRLFVSGGVAQSPYTEEIDAIAAFGGTRGPISPLVHQPLIGGGRYAVAATDHCESVACVVVDWQGVAQPVPHRFHSIVATDPVRPRVFVQTASGAVDAVDIETGTMTAMFTASAGVSGPCRYAFSAARLFCIESGTGPALRVLSTSGEPGEAPYVAGTVGASASGLRAWLVTPDGSRLFVGESGAAPAQLVLTYVATGQRVAVDLPVVSELAWDDFNARLLVVPTRVGHVFSEDLAALGSASFPYTFTALAVSPATGRLYTRGLLAQSAGFGDAFTTAFDSGSYAPLTPTVHTMGFGGAPRVTVLSPPGAPRGVVAMVQGRDVALRWTNVGFASAFLVDIGTTPGQTLLTVPVSWRSGAAFGAVPAGIYYVRIRGANAFGTGRASSEVRVVVP